MQCAKVAGIARTWRKKLLVIDDRRRRDERRGTSAGEEIRRPRGGGFSRHWEETQQVARFQLQPPAARGWSDEGNLAGGSCWAAGWRAGQWERRKVDSSKWGGTPLHRAAPGLRACVRDAQTEWNSTRSTDAPSANGERFCKRNLETEAVVCNYPGILQQQVFAKPLKPYVSCSHRPQDPFQVSSIRSRKRNLTFFSPPL
jgi:hypothetical protein